MGKFFLYLTLSLAIHLTAVACFGAMQFFNVQKEVKKKKILYVKNIKKSNIKKSSSENNAKNEQKKPNIEKKSPPKSENKSKVDKPKIDKSVIKKDINKNNNKKPKPQPTKTPVPVKTSPPPKKKTEEEIKIETLKKIPAFKNWSEERLKNIELPPGLKSWSDVQAVEKELNKLNLLPAGSELGNTAKPESTPIPENTPLPSNIHYMNWKEYKFENNKEVYEIKFYNQDTGYILTIDKKEMKIFVKYFDFKPDESKKDKDNTIEVFIPENIPEEEIKTFELPLTPEDLELEKNPDEDKRNKDRMIRDVIRQKEMIEQ